MALGGRFSHISDLGAFARLAKTSGFERPPSETKENTAAAAAESEFGIHLHFRVAILMTIGQIQIQ